MGHIYEIKSKLGKTFQFDHDEMTYSEASELDDLTFDFVRRGLIHYEMKTFSEESWSS